MPDENPWPPAFPHRGWETDPRRQAAHNNRIQILLKRLADLERDTRPSGGEDTAARKDGRAFDALSFAMDLVEAVAGWAIDHQIGLAAAGLQYVPMQPSGTQEHPDYLRQLAAVDTHEHERVGSQYNAANWPKTQEFRRRALVNLLTTMHTHSLNEHTYAVAEALRALEFGEALPLFKPNKTGRKAKYRALLLQLKALGLIEFRVALDIKKKAAQKQVAGAFGIGEDAVRNWEARLRDEDSGIGALKVSRELSWARNAASFVAASRRGDGNSASVAESSLARYGDEALARAGLDFQAATRDVES